MEEVKQNMFYGASPQVFEFAKRNRANLTPAESYLWNFLCKNQLNGLRFKSQHPTGPYIADFYCHTAKIVIELDGSIHKLPEIAKNDQEKDEFYQLNGLKVLRFTNQEVFQNINKVLNKIKEYTSPHSGVRGLGVEDNIIEYTSPPSGVRGLGVEDNIIEYTSPPLGVRGLGVEDNIIEYTSPPSGVRGLGVEDNIVEYTSPPSGVRGGMKLIECPRDAIQGLHDFIPTEKKAKYINLLLESNLFDTIDFGSFVSSKAIPQMADTKDLVKKLDLNHTKTKLLAIIANERGASEACSFDEITYLGYPFSISETFQLRNTNATIAESLERVKLIQDTTQKADKQLVIYISMGFGNPYGDVWNVEIVLKWVDELQKLGIKIFSLSDTVGVAKPDAIKYLFENLIPKYPNLEFGSHLHTTPDTWQEKIDAAYNAGCRRFDGAILGYGGCPMAADELVGNMAMENLLSYHPTQPSPTGEGFCSPPYRGGVGGGVEILKSSFQELIS